MLGSLDAWFVYELGRYAASPQVAWQGVAALGGFDLVLGVLTYLVATSVIPMLAGADRLTISATGIRLSYQTVAAEDLAWNDGRTSFTLLDFSEQPPYVGANRAYRIDLSRRLPVFGVPGRRSLLTKEAFDAILTASRSHGLLVHPYRPNALSEPDNPRAYQIESS